ncbi:Cell division control protein 42 [Mycena indigotica]|uniref:Cell division control protein 42 n=1 Tax=Mycena indigotica TaxID=2126181 RepID=A0A8H6TCY8_9AGAR|nr:Cell division control protein 42 [Mycena indigotica]KAF7315413.1 Cell division control protein 42 [Mycena indigotica]
MKRIKTTVLGDDGVGKTSMLYSYTSKKFPADYCPSIFCSYAENVVVDGVPYNHGLFDTAGSEEYDRLRPLSYPLTDVFLVCFSVESFSSFESCRTKWFPEAEHHCPGVPLILVAMKTDLRDNAETVENLANEHRRPISAEQGLRLSRELSASRYVECSGLTQEGLKELFDEAFAAAIEGKAKRKSPSRCTIL